jgi:hypothetical protein
MKNIECWLLWIGRGAGIAGVLICAVAVVIRLTGTYWIGGFQLGTLLLAGMAAMMLACLSYLVVLTERTKSAR